MAEAQPLTADVVATIDALLPPGTPGREELLAQLPHSRTGERCACGCATVDLIVDRSAVRPANVTSNPIAEASFTSDDGTEAGGVLLFAEAGYLSLLEIYTYLDKPMTT